MTDPACPCGEATKTWEHIIQTCLACGRYPLPYYWILDVMRACAMHMMGSICLTYWWVDRYISTVINLYSLSVCNLTLLYCNLPRSYFNTYSKHHKHYTYLIAAWKVTGPGLEPRPFWNCTRCSTIELSGPLGYRNVTGFPIPSYLTSSALRVVYKPWHPSLKNERLHKERPLPSNTIATPYHRQAPYRLNVEPLTKFILYLLSLLLLHF